MRIVVLAGPPCAGKTTLAHTLAQPDDVVLDYDDIAHAMGSPTRWIHPEPWRTQAELEMQHLIAQAHAHPSNATCWVLRTTAGQQAQPNASASGTTATAHGPATDQHPTWSGMGRSTSTHGTCSGSDDDLQWITEDPNDRRQLITNRGVVDQRKIEHGDPAPTAPLNFRM